MRKLQFTPAAEKQLEKLIKKEPAIASQMAGVIEDLRENPLAGEIRKLKGYLNDYRVKMDKYRIVYSFTDDEVEVVVVGHRSDVYKKHDRMKRPRKKRSTKHND